ncbi:hypothetical protein K2173_015927 [Erythroxylum novogranatense]|uniref:Uncharacterized protein n=1 Tax=Erythroxylum novogranatense TaxID=1862640 RepID=A0AAV8SES8_9ROSI|nr:hypothetical protein K2173_015927 [Erythroxylum novogranatense]
MSVIFRCIDLVTGCPSVGGDEDEEDIDDFEYEFKIENEQEQNQHLTEAMLHGKMTYGRGHDDEKNSQFPPVIAGIRSRPIINQLVSGSARWEEKKEAGWKDRVDEWKLQQGNLRPEPEDDPEAAAM